MSPGAASNFFCKFSNRLFCIGSCNEIRLAVLVQPFDSRYANMEHQARQSSAKQFPFTQFVEHNRLGVIENPLRRIPEDKLKDFIESFHEINKLGTVVDPATLVRGARLARDEEAFVAEEKAEENLTYVESTALDKEKGTTIWSETREIKIILLICCVGSVLQGWVSQAIRLLDCLLLWHEFIVESP